MHPCPRHAEADTNNMAERRKHRKRFQEVGEPTKEEKAVAKYLRFNCPIKSTNMMGHRVDYFIASKGVDCLLDSKWSKAKKGEEALFTTRDSVVEYCNRLLKKQFFHRALKVVKMKPEKDAKKEKDKGKTDSGKEDEKKSRKEIVKEEKNKKEKDKKKDAEKDESKKDDAPGTPKKKKETKRRFKLEPHEDQIFLDGSELYVWIYDPVHFKTFAMGLILVIAVIAATLFPLWPAEMRVGVYYLSVAAGCFVASILFLAVARCILFLIIWLVTGGRHHFWFLPNLTADVGFIDSFRPLYTHEYKGPTTDSQKDDEKLDSEKQHKSDSEEKSDSENKDGQKAETVGSFEANGSGVERHSDTDSDKREEDGSQHSNGNGNDFEMITKEELEQHTDDEEEDCEEEEEEEEEEETEPQKPLHKKS